MKLTDFQNKSCIYFKNPTVCFGQMESYFIGENTLDLTLECQEIPGLQKVSAQMELYCNWVDLSVMQDHIICYDEGWHLFFNESLIDNVVRIAQKNPASDDRLLEIMDRILGFLSSGN
jgi:hypothetical protein